MAYLNESGLRTLWQKILAKNSATLTSANSYTDEALEALKIGGRNLLRGTQYWDSAYWDISSKASIDGEILTLDGSALTSGYTEIWQKVNLTAGKTYTLSVDFIEQIASASGRKVNIFAYDMNSAVSGRTHNIINEDTPIIGKHSGTFTVPEGSSEFRIYIRAYSSAAFKIKNVQLEEGEKATAWEPAFEDLIEYTDEAIADITPNSIGAVSQTDFNALEIGGRNMLLSSKDLPTTTSSSDITAYQIGNTDQSRVVGDDGYAQLHWTLSGLTSSLWKAVYTPVYKLPDGWQGRKVVISAWVYADDWSTLDDGMYWTVNLSTGNRTRTHYKSIEMLLAGGALHATNGHGDTPTNGAWKRVWTTWDLTESKLNGSGTFANNTHIYITFSVVTNGILAIKQPKLEFGTRPTDWTPATEDMDISIVPIEKGGTGATTTAEARTNLEITPANIGAVNKTGDTMTGSLYFKNGTSGASTMQIGIYNDNVPLIKYTDADGNVYNTLAMQPYGTQLGRPLLVESGGTGATDALDAFIKLSHRTDGAALTSGSLNDLRDPGFYAVNGLTDGPSDAKAAGNLLVLPYRLTGNINPVQLYFTHYAGNTGEVYFRHYYGAGSTWKEWHKLYSDLSTISVDSLINSDTSSLKVNMNNGAPLISGQKNNVINWAIGRASATDNSLKVHYYNENGNWISSGTLLDSGNYSNYLGTWTTLWSGTLTVGNTATLSSAASNYKMLCVEIEGTKTEVIPWDGQNTHAGFSRKAINYNNEVAEAVADLQFTGTTAKLDYCYGFAHKANGSHTPMTTQDVTAIYGYK